MDKILLELLRNQEALLDAVTDLMIVQPIYPDSSVNDKISKHIEALSRRLKATKELREKAEKIVT